MSEKPSSEAGDTVREALAGKRGRELWRSLEELAGTPVFEEMIRREFPSQAHRLADVPGRREFLKLMGASLALAGVGASCTRQPEDRRLRERVRRPEARRVIRIPFDLRRTSLVALDEDGLCISAEGNRGGEEQRLARHEVFGLPHIRNDLLGRLFRAGAHAGQRERRAHQLQELAAALRIVPLRGLFGKFTVQVLAELRRVRQLAEAAPIQAALGTGQT